MDGNMLKMTVKVIWDLILKKGKVFQKKVNIVCSTFTHCLYNICLIVWEKKIGREYIHSTNSLSYRWVTILVMLGKVILWKVKIVFSYCITITWFLRGIDEDNTICKMWKKIWEKSEVKGGYVV